MLIYLPYNKKNLNFERTVVENTWISFRINFECWINEYLFHNWIRVESIQQLPGPLEDHDSEFIDLHWLRKTTEIKEISYIFLKFKDQEDILSCLYAPIPNVIIRSYLTQTIENSKWGRKVIVRIYKY